MIPKVTKHSSTGNNQVNVEQYQNTGEFFSRLPTDVTKGIFEYLNLVELSRAAPSCHHFDTLKKELAPEAQEIGNFCQNLKKWEAEPPDQPVAAFNNRVYGRIRRALGIKSAFHRRVRPLGLDSPVTKVLNSIVAHSNFPKLDPGDYHSIDVLQPNDLSSPIMQGVDQRKGLFISFKMRDKNRNTKKAEPVKGMTIRVVTLRQSLTEGGLWVYVGDHQCIRGLGGEYVGYMNSLSLLRSAIKGTHPEFGLAL